MRTELKQHAVAYFNSDGNGRGFFRAEGSHSLENFVNSVIKDIQDPETKMTVWKRAAAGGSSHARPPETSRRDCDHAPTRASGRWGRARTTPSFIDHLGVASVNLGLRRRGSGGGQYHSIYDDFYWYTHFADTDFAYGRALAQTAGTMMMRMADADVMPFQFTDLAEPSTPT